VVAVDNGVLDLNDLSVTPVPDVVAYPHAPERMLTRKIGVRFDPDAQAPRWRRYLEEVLPDAAYRDYLQRAIGMTLLGDTSEAAFFVLHGQTGCGKSVFFEVMQEAFGDFAATAAPNTFRDTKDDGSRRANDLHALRGARFVATSETSERTMLNEELVKRVTGGDMISSHALYQSNISWKPQFTIFMASNFKPKLNPADGAIWRRVKPIEFPNTFYNEDGSAKEAREGKLGQWLIDNELAGILNWILEGVRAYLTEGLGEPPALREAVKEYREESDGVSEFLTNAADEGIIVLDPKSEVTVAQAYSVYVEWVRQNNGFPMGKIKFGNRMTELGYEAVKTPGGVRVRRGIGINPHTWQAQAQGGTRPQGFFPGR
jgi:putative DNA primase/helicase